MVKKYEEAIAKPYKMKANREFMMMMKILLKENVTDKKISSADLLSTVPLVGVKGTKRIEVYDDELTYTSPTSFINLVQMSSEETRHFFLIAMQEKDEKKTGKSEQARPSVVFKYDLVSKQLLF